MKIASPIFLDITTVLATHQAQFARHRGSSGVLDMKLLESAIPQPQAAFFRQYLHGGQFVMAAAYLFHVAQNHPLVDGNMRTALASMLMFFALNDVKSSAGVPRCFMCSRSV